VSFVPTKDSTEQIADSKEAGKRLRNIMVTDPAGAVVGARVYAKSCKSDSGRLSAAGVLVDAGLKAGDRKATTPGLVTIRRLLRRNPDSGELHYMLGTAYSTLARHDKTPHPEWWERTRKLQIDSRRELWLCTQADASSEARAHAWINLGNELERCGRWDEAYGAFLHAFGVQPNHPVAAGWLAEMLLRRRAIASGTGWVDAYYKYSGIANSNLAAVARIAPGAEAVFRKFPQRPSGESSRERSKPESSFSPFDHFVSSNRLHLSMDLQPQNPECWDQLDLTRIQETNTSSSKPPAIFARSIRASRSS
jgi:hypothetical protein